MKKIHWAQIMGWGQLAVTYANQVLQANGGLLPTDKAGWCKLAGSALLAGGIHQASKTSADNPAGQK